MRTKSGHELTPEDLDRLAEEAEAGFDLSRARRRYHPMAELRGLLAARSVRRGPVVLSGGNHSDIYFDVRQITLHGRGLSLLSRVILQRCYELGVSAVGGVALGADPIVAGVAALSGDAQPLDAFIVRRDVTTHGTSLPIEGPSLRVDQSVVLVDDVLTTGASLLFACDRVIDAGAVPVEAIVVVDREEGGREALAARGLPLRALFRRSDFA